MKKIHALLAVGVLMTGCACTLSGCGSSGDNSSDDKDGNGYADEIYLYNWSEYMTQDILDQFEEEYGIKVIETTFESNDELLAKLIAGKEGEYDIAVPTNTYIQAFKDNDLLEPFDEGAITNIGNLDDAYRGLAYDANNEYTIPYMGTLSIMLGNTPMLEELGVSIHTAEDLLNPALENNILLYDDVQGDIMLGLLGTDNDPVTKDLAAVDDAKEYLLQLNPNLKSFSQIADERISITRGEVAAAYIYSGDAVQAVLENDQLAVVMDEEPIPLSIDNFVILKGTKHKKEAQLFIDFLLRPEVSAELAGNFPYVCFNKEAAKLLPEEIVNTGLVVLSDDVKERLFIIDEKDGEMLDKMVTVMTEVKSAK